MHRGQILVELDDCGDLHLYPQLADIPVDSRAPIMAALASQWGVELHKAAPAGGPPMVDPRFPFLGSLIGKAKKDWSRWSGWLVKTLLDLLFEGQILPQSSRSAPILRELFETHKVGLQLSITARSTGSAEAERRAQQTGLVTPAGETAVEIAYQMGRGLDALAVAQLQPERAPEVAEVLRQAHEVPLTAQDEIAMDWAQQHAAVSLAKPSDELATEAQREILTAQRQLIGETISTGIGQRWSAQQTASELRKLETSPGPEKDMERIAVTEIHSAHAWGAFQALKSRADAMGLKDPLVYKTVNRMACKECRRIWGPFGEKPVLYRLSQVEAHEHAGGNFGRPKHEWGPTIGPTHPRCTCPTLAIYRPELEDAIRDTVAAMVKRRR